MEMFLEGEIKAGLLRKGGEGSKGKRATPSTEDCDRSRKREVKAGHQNKSFVSVWPFKVDREGRDRKIQGKHARGLNGSLKGGDVYSPDVSVSEA